MTHARYTTAMRESPRCGARARAGTPCRSPAIAGKKRCRMHGGAKASGEPAGNRNALKHGRFTQENQRFERAILKLIRDSEPLIEES